MNTEFHTPEPNQMGFSTKCKTIVIFFILKHIEVSSQFRNFDYHFLGQFVYLIFVWQEAVLGMMR